MPDVAAFLRVIYKGSRPRRPWRTFSGGTMAKTISMLVLVAAVVGVAGTARAADKAAKAGTGACYFELTGACLEKYTPDMCSADKVKFTPGACPTENRVGTCTMGGGRVMRLYKDRPAPRGYTEKDAAAYCSGMGGKFQPG
jgi:hypothetical protein